MKTFVFRADSVANSIEKMGECETRQEAVELAVAKSDDAAAISAPYSFILADEGTPEAEALGAAAQSS